MASADAGVGRSLRDQRRSRVGLAGFVGSHAGSTSCTSGCARSAGVSMSSASSGSRRTATGSAGGDGLREMAAERTRRRTRTRSDSAVGSATTLVPSPRESGTSVTVPAMATRRRARVARGRSPCATTTCSHASVAEVGDAAVDGGVEADARVPQHGGAVRRGPLGDAVVVARDEHGQLAGGGEHPLGGPARQCLALGGRQHGRRAAPWHRRMPSPARAPRRSTSGIVDGERCRDGPDLRCAPCRSTWAVIGAGSWGTTVAALAAVNTPTVLWARRPELADADQHRARQRRLPAGSSRCPSSCGPPPRWRRPCPAPTCW